jgi:hypothetical protein
LAGLILTLSNPNWLKQAGLYFNAARSNVTDCGKCPDVMILYTLNLNYIWMYSRECAGFQSLFPR